MLVRPYSSLAATYDFALGIPMFQRMREIFERLRLRFGLLFGDAADLGCGTGLFCRYLAERFRIPVTGVDLSPAMLAVAERRCRGLPVRLLCQDMCRLTLPSPVDLTTCNFDAINHVTIAHDIQETFRRVQASLRPGGHFLFDVLTPCQELPPLLPNVYRSCRPGSMMLQIIRWDPATRLLSGTVVVRRRKGICSVERHFERLYPPGDILRWLREAKLTVRAMLDPISLEPARYCHPRLILLAQRPG